MKRKNHIFKYNKIYFENGIKDKKEHPLIIAGSDEKNFYCFIMTSKIRNTAKNSHARNIFNKNIYYVKTKPNKNCQINNNVEGLIETSFCLTVPIEIAELYPKYGFVKPEVTKEVITKWAYQQNEIKDKPVQNYNEICLALGINDSIKETEIYKYCVTLMNNYPDELQLQREYAKELREYLEAKKKAKVSNLTMPKLKDNKDIYQSYLYENFKFKTNQLDDLKKLYEKEEEIDQLKQQKKEFLKIKNENEEKNKQETQTHHRRAA